MRTNLPVTKVEYPIHDDTLIVSKTDTKGKLTYFNDQFVAASGFTEAELIGQPHNIIRHPDMPAEAFEDLWTTLKTGKPWARAVKNRRKNGDFYWVLASATPIWENGNITGFMSIRSKLPADQRREAEHVYELLRTKKAQDYTVTAGIIRRRSLADRLSFFNGSLKARLITLISVQAAFMVVDHPSRRIRLRPAPIHRRQRRHICRPVPRPSARRMAGPADHPRRRPAA